MIVTGRDQSLPQKIEAMKKLLLLFLLIISTDLHSQDLSANLSTVAGQYAQSYLQPFIDVYGAGVNSGFFNTVKLNSNSDSKLTITLSVKSMGSFVPSNSKTFSAVYNTSTSYDTLGQTYIVNATATVKNAPTIFGSSNKGTVTTNISDTIVVGGVFHYPIHRTRVDQTFGGLVTTDVAPFLVPQLDIGTVLGTQFMLRWIPPVQIGNYGTTNFFGIGLRHNLSQYIGGIPFNLAGGFYYQNFSMKDTAGNQFINSTAVAANLQISKNLGLIELYGAFQYESSSLNAAYAYISSSSGQNPNYTVNVNFNIKGKNTLRILGGASLSTGGFFINADFNLASTNTFTFGIGYNIF